MLRAARLRNSSSQAVTSRSAPSKSPLIGKVYAIAGRYAACKNRSLIPASSGARRWRAASVAVSSPASTASTAAAQASSARASGPPGPDRRQQMLHPGPCFALKILLRPEQTQDPEHTGQRPRVMDQVRTQDQ